MPTAKKIFVKAEDFGFWTQQEIPIVRYEQVDEDERQIVFCSHAGAELKEIEQEYPRIDQPDIVWKDSLIICRKCGAWRLDGDNQWQNTPFEGRHDETADN